MTSNLNIAIAQGAFTVGDLPGNFEIHKQFYDRAVADDADLVIFSELSVCGYPPEDMVLMPSFQEACLASVDKLLALTKDQKTAMLVGTPWLYNGRLYNAVLLLERDEITAKQYKFDLPNYGVFDEKRVFESGPLPKPIPFKNLKLGLMICEDMWSGAVATGLEEADFLLAMSASPFEIGKHEKRLERASRHVRSLQKPLLYTNQVCGQDDLVFDGDSFVLSRDEQLRVRLSRTAEDYEVTRWQHDGDMWRTTPGRIESYNDSYEVMYQSLVLGLRDYVERNQFPSIVLGMSGGIDSALCATIATDAIGPDKVHAIMLPSKYTSQESPDDAQACAENLGITYDTIPIEPMVDIFHAQLTSQFENTTPDLTEENLQSRVRGTTLMALSNKFGHLLLATGNKSEYAVGYSTLYGDMCGGYAPIKDVYKVDVWQLARWRNANTPENSQLLRSADSTSAHSPEPAEPRPIGPDSSPASGGKPIIPTNIITKAPTAELRPDQKDEDSLPPYDTLDEILRLLIEEQLGIDDIIARGFDSDMVHHVRHLLHRAEYKRRQSPPGIKVTARPFSRDRRYPITNKFTG